MPRPLVFISYAHQDSSYAETLKAELDQALLGAVRIFVASDRGSIRPGDTWRDQIINALRESAVVIVVASPRGILSPWVNFESGGGWITGAQVIPCCVSNLSPSELPPPLNQLQALDLSKEEGVADLFRFVTSQAELRYPGGLDASSIAQRIREIDSQQASSMRPPRMLTGEEGQFAAFIGGDVRMQPVRLVFPQFEFSPPVRKLLEDAALHTLYDKPRQREFGRGKDLIQPVAANDLRALCTVAEMLGKVGMSFQPMPDLEAKVAAAKGHFTAISFGLTSNELTLMYLDYCETSGRTPLFQSLDVGHGRSIIRLCNGVELEYEGDRYGLIARVRPNNAQVRERWVLCAGLGPTGTEAAANFLCDSWPSLAALTGDRDFITVVTCRPGEPGIYHSNVDSDTIISDA